MAKARVRRLPRERAKEILADIDTLLASANQQKARASVVRLLNTVPSYSWVGIYFVNGGELVLDSWSGPKATEHVRIPLGKGICGFAARSGRTEIVPAVNKDPRYLECFITTESEMVVPILRDGKVVGEIDIDSEIPDAFSSVDKEFIEVVARKMAPYCPAQGAASIQL
jgi:GAF domain-containing protein